MLEKAMVDADFCIKLGGSEKYRFLSEVLPLLSNEVYMHQHAYGEVMYPISAKRQLDDLINNGVVRIVHQNMLSPSDRAVYDSSYKVLERVMINPTRPNKNKGEVCSLSYAKSMGISYFVSDESLLQPLVDKHLNTGIGKDIKCIRIRDVIEMIRTGEICLSRKHAKAIWRISFGSVTANAIFDREIWPL